MLTYILLTYSDMLDREDLDQSSQTDTSDAYCHSNKTSITVTEKIQTGPIYHAEVVENVVRFQWTEGQISVLNSAFFMGYVPAIIPG